MSTFSKEKAESFIDNYNFRPLVLTFQEIQSMKNAVGSDNGVLFICPVFCTSEGIPEHDYVVNLRYFLYKKQETTYVPLRFDFKPILGFVDDYFKKIKNATFPCFEIPQSPTPNIPVADSPINLDYIFSFVSENPNGTFLNKENYFIIFLQRNEDETISLHSKILQIKPGGGEGPGGDCPVTSGPPPKQN